MKVILSLLCIAFSVLVSKTCFAAGTKSEETSTVRNPRLFGFWGRRYPTITFPCLRMRSVCANIRRAFSMGKPRILTRITDTSRIRRNRRLSGCRSLPPSPGCNCDEYPFASSRQGGPGAVVRLVPIRENSIQGGLLAGFYLRKRIRNGDRFRVELGL